MRFSRADEEGVVKLVMLDGVRPPPNFSSLLSTLLSPRPNVINWHVTLEAGVCMYSLHPRRLPLCYVCSIQLSFQVSIVQINREIVQIGINLSNHV